MIAATNGGFDGLAIHYGVSWLAPSTDQLDKANDDLIKP